MGARGRSRAETIPEAPEDDDELTALADGNAQSGDGCSATCRTSRTTPMLGAFKFGDVDVANTLLDLGALVDFADGNGITMLGRTVLNNARCEAAGSLVHLLFMGFRWGQ